MKKILIAMVLCLPLTTMAQTETDRVAALQAEAAAKAKAAQEAAKAAQEAARAAQEAATAAAEAAKIAQQSEQQSQQAQQKTTTPQESQSVQKAAAAQQDKQTPAAVTNAQPQQTWSLPSQTTKQKDVSEKEKKKEAKKAKAAQLAPYLAADAVPVIDGDVQWELNIQAPGKSAKQIYDTMLNYMTQLTKEEIQLERSKVAIVNESEHSIVATMQEWLTFTSNFLSLDRTKFNYVLIANCKDGAVQVLLNRISYDYSLQGKEENYKAENWITDKAAVNKKRTRLYPITGKFRRNTIDRKNEIFQQITETIQAL